MARTLMLLALLVIILLIFNPFGCGSSGGGGSSPAPVVSAPEAASEPLPVVAIASVRELGPIETSGTILMRDCGYSAQVGGKSVWLFGDTLLDFANEDNTGMLCNSWSSTYDVDAGDGLAGFEERVDDVGAPVPFFPLTEQEQAFNAAHAGTACAEEPCHARWSIWPGTMVVDDLRQLVFAFYHKVYSEVGEFNFRHVGHSIAVWRDLSETAERPVFSYYDEYPTLFFAEDRDGFGSAAVLVGEDLYVYGCEMLAGDIVKPCRLARVLLADILDREAWAFYAGDGDWSADIGDAAVVFYGNNMMSVFYNEYIGQYMTIYSQPMDTRVVLRTAPSPAGPWSEPLDVFIAEPAVSSKGWIYDALAHPQYAEGGGQTIYITYTRQTGPAASEMRQIAVVLEKLN